MSQVDQLFRLQQADDALRKAKKRLAHVMRMQSESEEMASARAREETVAGQLEKWRVSQNDLNLELQSLNAKAKRSEDRLYSGMVKNPKELEDLQREIESLGRRRTALEDELLEAMIAVEEAQDERQKAGLAYNEIKERWERQQQALKQEQDELVERIDQLDGQRESLLQLITSTSLATYENTAKRVGSLVVVELRNHRCTGCQVRVPDNLVKAADVGELVYCDNCRRILCPT